MNKFDEERLYRLRHGLETYLPQVLIYTDFEGTYLHILYDGKSVCKIRTDGSGYKVNFTSEFGVNEHESTQWFPGYRTISESIRIAIQKYKKGQEVKNMAKRRFIVEKMEVEQRCCEPDVINMTVRKEPDGIPFQTGRELRTLIESLDPDKLSSLNDYRININMADNIKNVIFNDPATIVFWTDGSKTVVKCQPGETFDPEKGLAMAISKKFLGNDYGYYETFAKYIGRYNKKRFKKALEEAKKITPDEVVYNGRTYKLTDEYTVKSKEE